MERTPNCCPLTSLVALAILVLFPGRSWCEEHTNKLPAQANKQECCVSGAAELKRFDDIDYDSFVSLMGRRSAAQEKRDMDHILTALLGRRTSFNAFRSGAVTPPKPQHAFRLSHSADKSSQLWYPQKKMY